MEIERVRKAKAMDLASIAAELRRVLPVEHWHLVDKLVDYALDDIVNSFRFRVKEMMENALKEAFDERNRTTLLPER